MLVENPNQHIGSSELAKLLEESRCRQEAGRDATTIHPHFAICSTCREQFDSLAGLDQQLKDMRLAECEDRSNNCPGTTVWPEVAVGVASPDDDLVYLEHASRCDHCGPLLREAVAKFADLNPELTEEERKHVASLDSARAEWQERLARRITGISPALDRKFAPWRRGWLSIPRQAMVGASLLAVVAIVAIGSWIIIHGRQPAAAEKLLARAYTEKRTLELRFAGADAAYAPMHVARGTAQSFRDNPKELLSAEALIASQLESQPSNPAWLQAQAEADMLEGKYEPAVETLTRALELEPHSPALLTDLGTAYFQRGWEKERTEDFGAAYEYLSQSLRLQPDDPVALFNRAIVSEHQFLYQQALDDWDHYLQVDSASRWAEEARNRANALREKLKEHKSSGTPLLSPDQLVATNGTASPPSEVDQRIEEYLREAIHSWLPKTFPVRVSGIRMNERPADATEANAEPASSRALFFLADLTSLRHGDRWLADLLRGSSAPRFAQAVNALARAGEAHDTADYDVSHEQAHLAEQLFRASGNMAGVLRAQFQEIIIEQLTRRSDECRRNATAALAESEKYPYPWLQIQLGLEKSICSDLMGDLGAGQKAVLRALDRAQQNGYVALYLRAAASAADCEFLAGDQAGGSKLASAGLKGYWSAPYPAMRGYNLYTELALNAEAIGRSNLQLAIWREAVSLIDSDENLLRRAWAHNAMGNAAAFAHLPQDAELQYAEAARLFAAAPRTEASRHYALETEVRTAQIESHMGRFDDAIARLTAIQDQVRPLSNNYLAEMFYSTLGELQLGRHREAEAEQALRPALALAEQNLATLSEAERTAWSKNAAPAYLALVEAELVRGRSQEALETYEWYLGAPQRVATDSRSQRPRNSPPLPDPSWLVSRLPIPSRDTVLTYAALPDGLAIWVYGEGVINASWIPEPTDGLQELAERFHDLSSDPSSELSALRRDARNLYEQLIAPVEQHLTPGRTLVIEADGWLARVPFEALLDANGHYLIERTPIVHSLGQDSQARLRSDTGISADLPALVVGSAASLPAEGLIPLTDVAAEADMVANDFHSARVLERGEATLSAVQSELPSAAVFHFAGHALAAPGRTGLLLENGDGTATPPLLMDATVVRQLHLQDLQLAVLSACSTASGGGSSGFDSVTDALLRAGVPHVVASRWTVDSVQTQRFVVDFYRKALSGETVSDAMRQTARAMLAQRNTSHPYYWSAFAAYGRP